LVALASFLPGWAKDLSAPRYFWAVCFLRVDASEHVEWC